MPISREHIIDDVNVSPAKTDFRKRERDFDLISATFDKPDLQQFTKVVLRSKKDPMDHVTLRAATEDQQAKGVAQCVHIRVDEKALDFGHSIYLSHKVHEVQPEREMLKNLAIFPNHLSWPKGWRSKCWQAIGILKQCFNTCPCRAKKQEGKFKNSAAGNTGRSRGRKEEMHDENNNDDDDTMSLLSPGSDATVFAVAPRSN
ncbi:hypothetical protein BKA81DRAFT_377857 [Phyllosticta paracitricarpa]|uniref:Uncharacterized protein n=1 Tax=Phyllosticta paracitricarpa TaxID=2016321 RepID=A0ABR1N5N3_9PEZI